MHRKRIKEGVLLLAASLLLTACGSSAAPAPAAKEPDGAATEAETAVPEQPAEYREVYEAWLSLLTENREEILGYDWQKGMVFDEEIYETVPAGVTTPVVLADVWGGEEPELLFLTALETDGWRYGARLHVYTWEPSGARELLSDVDLDMQVGGGMSYRLFQVEGSKALWIACCYYSEGTEDAYTRYSAEGAMEAQEAWEHWAYPVDDDSAEDGWRMEETWSRNGADCTQQDYEAAIPALEKQKLLMRNALYYEYMDDVETPADAVSLPLNGEALSCDGAVALLRDKLGIQPESEIDEAAFFEALPDFSFASGVGGWGTELSIEADGSFYGVFHDSNMGEDGPDYPNGTVYISVFSGRFGNVQYVDEYTRSMRMLELKTDRPTEEEWIEDGVRYVSSTPYGLDNADELLVYLPGAWLQSLPHEFVTWVAMPHAWGDADRPVLLPFYGLYNVAEQEGFSGEIDAGTVYAQWADDLPEGTYESFTADAGEPAVRVLLTASAPVSDFKVLALTAEPLGSEGITFRTRELYALDTLSPEHPLVLTTVFHGDTPGWGISYVDGNGTEQRFALDISGMDGSLYLSSF